MKTTNFCYILLTSALLFSSSLFAQEKPQRGKRLTPEQRIERQVEKWINNCYWTMRLQPNSFPYTKNTLQPWQNADKTCLPPKELVKKN